MHAYRLQPLWGLMHYSGGKSVAVVKRHILIFSQNIDIDVENFSQLSHQRIDQNITSLVFSCLVAAVLPDLPVMEPDLLYI